MLGDWRAERRRWFAEHGVPVDFELHARDFLAGRGRPGGRNPLKIERYRMAQSALELLGAQSALTITTAWTVHPAGWRAAKGAAYRGLLRSLDRLLDRSGEHGALIVDGDGSDAMYEEAHTEVRPARVPRPAVQVPAHVSDWLQMADLVAHTAFQAIARQESRRALWGWYSRYFPKAPAPERC
ncbi:hypothetical protein [Streptomyces sp. MP131-18]|uniref:hypothetical protein n=1 Tax=Streptomyces sp. MP131-18 TaxID=1857892 RepID=UPI00097C0D36|nr:hypothetical protein [Streptomyces sp. MP131-18]ONK15212.1 hypothetical protein STBA_60270 [Streptomyces sp. MP131-18]